MEKKPGNHQIHYRQEILEYYKISSYEESTETSLVDDRQEIGKTYVYKHRVTITGDDNVFFDLFESDTLSLTIADPCTKDLI